MRQSNSYESFTKKSILRLAGFPQATDVRLTRVFVDGPLTADSIVDLPKQTGAHLAKVLRARNGDELILFNGDGREFAGSIEAVHGAKVSVSIGAGRTVDRESPLSITLVQSVPRGDRMDFILQKATELGVRRIVPVLSQRSVVRLDEAQAQAKMAHWCAVALSASEQCGRNRLTLIDNPRPLLNYLGELAPHGTRWVFEPGFLQESPGDLPATPRTPPECNAVEVAIGPEGGFAAEELDAFQIAGFTRESLGPRVLRTETAAIAAIIWLQTKYGDM